MNKLINLLYGSQDVHTYYAALPEGCPNNKPKEFPDTSFADVESDLRRLNDQGYGIFFSPNPVEGRRKSENVKSINAVFIDIDDGRPDLPDFPIPPSAIVQTSKQGKWHIYWKVPRLKPEQFRPIQEMLIKYYDSDPAIKDPARLLRIPGFDHNKSTPTKVKLLQMADVAYLPEKIIEAHGGLVEETTDSNHNLKTVESLGELRKFRDWALGLEVDEGKRHHTAQRVANEGVALGATRDQTYTVVQACCEHWGTADRQEGKEAELIVDWAYKNIDPTIWQPTLIDLAISGQLKRATESLETEEDVYELLPTLAKAAPEDVASFKATLRKKKITIEAKELNKLIKEAKDKQANAHKTRLLKKANDEGKYICLQVNLYDDLASEFIRRGKEDMAGCYLRYYRDVWYEYDGGCYHERSKDEIEGRVWTWLAGHVVVMNEGIMSKYPVSSLHCQQVMSGIKAHRAVATDVELPYWITDSSRRARPWINFTNGLLDLKKATDIVEHSRDFFSTGQLTFEYNKDADCPTFMNTLDQWFEGTEREQSILLLQQITKYLLLGNTERQKWFMFIGVSRSGKSTMSELLRCMIADTVSTSMSSIGSEFGLHPLVGKSLAVLPDAHIGKTDKQLILDRFKGITGADTLTINRKGKAHVDAQLKARILVCTNELHTFQDPSGALAKRMIPLNFMNTFYGSENLGLLDKLKDELAGIFNWAMKADISGGFSLPESSVEIVREMKECSSSEVTFFEQNYRETEGDGVSEVALETSDLFESYKIWCEEEGIRAVKTKSGLVKALKSGLGKRFDTSRRRVNGERKIVVLGWISKTLSQKSEDEKTGHSITNVKSSDFPV